MTMNTLFPPKSPVIVPVVGSEQGFPINRIFCVGRNYMAHAAEMGMSVDKNSEFPFYFLKDAACYVPSGARIAYPPMTQNYHHEIECVVAIGQAGFEVSVEQANSLICGYACGLDMTRRDVQLTAREVGKPWDLGKNFEQSAILSDIVTVKNQQYLTDVHIQLSVNGEIRQSANTRSLIWSIPEIIADLSQYYHLQAGDLIYTGTPEGVGAVVRGDYLHGFIEGVAEIELWIDG